MLLFTAPLFTAKLLFAKARRTSGQSMVEFALTLPVLLLLVFGVIEMGRLLFVYSAVFTASREAARYGSAAGDNGSGMRKYQDCAGMRAAAMRMGSLAGIGTSDIVITYDKGPDSTPYAPLSDGCPPTNVAIEGGWNRVVVDVSIGFKPMLPLVNVPPFTITSRSARTIFKNIRPDVIPLTPTPGV